MQPNQLLTKTELKDLALSKQLVLFDMDGTILNSEPLHALAFKHTLDQLGLKLEIEELVEKFYGMVDEEVVKAVYPKFNDEEVSAIIDQKSQNLISIFKSLTHDQKMKYLSPGIESFCQMLKLNKIQSCVVTASEDIIAMETLEGFGVTGWINFYFGRGKTHLSKPNPSPYLHAMRLFGIKPESTLIFEDSPTGLKAASQTGASVVRMQYFAPGREISFAGKVIESFIT